MITMKTQRHRLIIRLLEPRSFASKSGADQTKVSKDKIARGKKTELILLDPRLSLHAKSRP